MGDKKLEALRDKVKSLKGIISTNDQRVIASDLGVHFNTIRNYLYGFGSDPKILNGILSYGDKLLNQ